MCLLFCFVLQTFPFFLVKEVFPAVLQLLPQAAYARKILWIRNVKVSYSTTLVFLEKFQGIPHKLWAVL